MSYKDGCVFCCQPHTQFSFVAGSIAVPFCLKVSRSVVLLTSTVFGARHEAVAFLIILYGVARHLAFLWFFQLKLFSLHHHTFYKALHWTPYQLASPNLIDEFLVALVFLL